MRPGGWEWETVPEKGLSPSSPTEADPTGPSHTPTPQPNPAIHIQVGNAAGGVLDPFGYLEIGLATCKWLQIKREIGT